MTSFNRSTRGVQMHAMSPSSTSGSTCTPCPPVPTPLQRMYLLRLLCSQGLSADHHISCLSGISYTLCITSFVIVVASCRILCPWPWSHWPYSHTGHPSPPNWPGTGLVKVGKLLVIYHQHKLPVIQQPYRTAIIICLLA